MNKSIKQIRIAAIVVALAITAAGIPARAAEVVVNGEAINPLELIVLTGWNCSNEVPAGRYWLDYASGEMGFENGAALGVLPCYPLAGASQEPAEPPQASDESDSGSWEDRMCARGMCGDGVIINPVYQ